MKSKKTLIFILAALLVAFALAVFASPYASSWPDGLERVAEDLGFIHKAPETGAWKKAPAPDYAIPGVKNEKNATAIAGLIGTAAVFLAGWGVAALIRGKKKTGAASGSE